MPVAEYFDKHTLAVRESIVLKHTIKKHVLPAATRLFAIPGLSRIPPFLEATGAALQSKTGGGYAAVWQEIEGASNFVLRPSPVIFDIGANVGNWASALRRLPAGLRLSGYAEREPPLNGKL
jgi:hypothetical protein